MRIWIAAIALSFSATSLHAQTTGAEAPRTSPPVGVVDGQTSSSSRPGVSGTNLGLGPGVIGTSMNTDDSVGGVNGSAPNGDGVIGDGARSGVLGRSAAGNGVSGISSAGGFAGVSAYNTNATGIGVLGGAPSPNGWAAWLSGRVYMGGKVGIAVSVPQTALHIRANTSENDLLTLETVSPELHGFRVGPGAGGNFFGFFDEQAGTDPMVITYTGNVGINTTAPSFRLHVNGEARADLLSIGTYVNNAGGPALCASAVNNRVGLCASSLRYKTDVHAFHRGLDVVARLRPISFTWKESGIHDVGLAAEDVARVDPLLTFTNPEGGIEGVRYNQLSAVLINAVQEQQVEIRRQEKRLKSQERDIEALKALVCVDHPAAAACAAPR